MCARKGCLTAWADRLLEDGRDSLLQPNSLVFEVHGLEVTLVTGGLEHPLGVFERREHGLHSRAEVRPKSPTVCLITPSMTFWCFGSWIR